MSSCTKSKIIMENLNIVAHYLGCGGRNIFFFIFGALVGLPFLILIVIVTIPAITYRWFVTRILAKSFICPARIRSATTLGFGSSYAAEYLLSISHSRLSRNAVVQQNLINGIVPFEECVEMVRTRWLEATKSSSDPTLKYPELKQHVTSWMGYTFWKEDADFQLENHMNLHKSPLNLEDYAKNLITDLLNKPFAPGCSPWEIHIVHSCNCSTNKIKVSPEQMTFCEQCGKEELTLFTTRFHHCIADGLSFMFAIRTVLGDEDTDSATKLKLQTAKVQRVPSLLGRTIQILQTLIQLCNELGFVAFFTLWRQNTNTYLHISDSKKSWRHFYERSSVFPIRRMKLIKNHFKTSFSAVIMSCVAAALSKRLKIVASRPADIENVLMTAVIPLDLRRVDKLANNTTGAAYKIPLKPDMNSVERLLACDIVMKKVNQSLFTQVVFPLIVKLMSFHVRPIARFALYNRSFGIATSNFSTLDARLWNVNGIYKSVKGYGAVGGNDGICGILVATIGYGGNFHFTATCDEAVMEKHELKAILHDIEDEIDNLIELVQKSDQSNGSIKVPSQGMS